MHHKTIFLLALALAVCTSHDAWAVSILTGDPILGAPTDNGDQFGNDVDVDPLHILVGADKADPVGFDSGAAHLFDASTGAFLRTLVAEDGQQLDRFGASVALADQFAVVGAFLEDERGDRAGAAYVFDVGTGQQLFKLTADDAQVADFFGLSIAASDGLAIVGSRNSNQTAENAGAAYVFDLATGEQRYKLTAPDGMENDSFGTGLDIDDRYAIVGANHISAGNPGSANGAVYLFDSQNGTFLREFVPDDLSTLDGFGQSVAISGDYAVVGTRLSSTAYIFEVSTGRQLHKLVPPAPALNFGNAVAASGSHALVGVAAGEVWVYDLATGKPLHRLIANSTQPGGLFGLSAALSGNKAVVGARSFNAGGAAFQYFVPEPATLSVFLTAVAFGLAVGRHRG